MHPPLDLSIGFENIVLPSSDTVAPVVAMPQPFVILAVHSDQAQPDIIVESIRIGTGADSFEIEAALGTSLLSERLAAAVADWNERAALANVTQQEPGYPLAIDQQVSITLRNDSSSTWEGAVDLVGLASDLWI